MTKLLQELDQKQELSSLMYREIMLTRIRTGLAFDAACCTTVDPQTLLTTGAITEQGLERIHGALLDNEYLHDDYNKFAELARSNAAASSLWEATGGRPELSRRYREVLQPAGFADELRAALRTGEACWGFLILFRKSEQGPFQQEELQFIRDIAPLIAGRLKAKALNPAALTDSGGQPEEGIIILDDRLEPVSQNPGGRYWLEQLQRMEQQSRPALPGPVRAVSLRALAGKRAAGELPRGGSPASGESTAAARVCFRAPDGRFINITASRLDGPSGLVQLAVSFTAAKAADLLPMVTEAYGFTEREKEIALLLSKGLSTKELALNLHISAYTVQDHLKSIFSKAGVSSRRELIWLLYSRYQ
ncbi:helix-turn-helix transcriptional regulator [Paenibacillus sp. FSL R7-0345]|uniref:helix-turn-helix transcriptional regulator n=1 Tax=Paenibacillus sp. FSL R7-0345 TaxID=2954535 RepID=UPI00315B15C1